MIMLYLRKIRCRFQFMLGMDPVMVCLSVSQSDIDNVPVWHSRRLVESVMERGGNITFIFIGTQLILDMKKFLGLDIGSMG
jgi:hypothetical protein